MRTGCTVPRQEEEEEEEQDLCRAAVVAVSVGRRWVCRDESKGGEICCTHSNGILAAPGLGLSARSPVHSIFTLSQSVFLYYYLRQLACHP